MIAQLVRRQCVAPSDALLRNSMTLPEEIEAAKEAHYAVHPNARAFDKDPHTLFLRFEPDWVRFSDLAANPPLVEEITLPAAKAK